MTDEKKLRRKLKKLVEENPDLIVEVLLEQVFWLKGIEVDRPYQRFSDDNLGSIIVSFSRDIDAWIEVISEIDPEELSFAHRFRMPMIGGGESERVRNALIILAKAIQLDNEAWPQSKRVERKQQKARIKMDEKI